MAGDPAGLAAAAQHSGAVPAADVCGSTAASDATDGRITAAAPQYGAAAESGSSAAGAKHLLTSQMNTNNITPLMYLTEQRNKVLFSDLFFSQASFAAGRQNSNQNGTSSTQSGPSQTTVSSFFPLYVRIARLVGLIHKKHALIKKRMKRVCH